MPIIIKDYTWNQTSQHINLTLCLKPGSRKKLNLIYTKSYIKASFSPYIFELFLAHNIVPEDSDVIISEEKIEFTLKKSLNEEWEEISLIVDNDSALKLRNEALKEYEQQEQELVKQKKEKKYERNRFSISEQLKLDADNKQQRQNFIQKQKDDYFSSGSTEDSEDLRRRHSSTCSDDGRCRSISETDYDGDGEDMDPSPDNLNTMIVKSPVNRKQKKSSSRGVYNNKNKKIIDILPPIRTNGSIKVNFTHRAFPTPKRESTEEQEIEILQSSQKSDENDSCKDIEFYRTKAISLFQNGDYKGCVNSLNEAIKLNPTQASFYSNRAAAYLALKKYTAAVEDCSKALEFLVPHTVENEKSRVLCHIRRGTAFVSLHKYHQGYSDYEIALQLDPDNKKLANDTELIHSKITSLTTTTETEETDEELSSEISATLTV